MGTRAYFYLVNNNKLEEISKIKLSSLKSFQEELSIDKLETIIGKNVFWEFGKHYENYDTLVKLGIPLFADNSMQSLCDNYNPIVIKGDAGVVNAIIWLKKQIIENLQELFMPKEEYIKKAGHYLSPEIRQKIFLEDLLDEWESSLAKTIPDIPDIIRCPAINMDTDTKRITDSWRYDMSIFELIRKWKTINWDRYSTVLIKW